MSSLFLFQTERTFYGLLNQQIYRFLQTYLNHPERWSALHPLEILEDPPPPGKQVEWYLQQVERGENEFHLALSPR
jgi:hypothetical protein